MTKTVFLGLGLAGLLHAGATPALSVYMDTLQKEAGSPFSAKRGEAVFFSKHQKDGKTIACTSCHTTDLTKVGENAKTGKKIDPLAPSANPEALTDLKNVKKWLRRNFKDVYGRKGTAQEKGDVLTYILSK